MPLLASAAAGAGAGAAVGSSARRSRRSRAIDRRGRRRDSRRQDGAGEVRASEDYLRGAAASYRLIGHTAGGSGASREGLGARGGARGPGWEAGRRGGVGSS